MSAFVVGSVAGAPGASSIALGVVAAWPEAQRRRVLVEADPDGGKFGADLGVGTEPGLMSLTVATRARRFAPAEVLEHGGAQMGGWWVVPAPASAEHSAAALVQAAPAFAQTVAADPGGLWVIDAGRVSPRSPSMAFASVAELVVLVTTGGLAALQLVPTRVDAFVGAGCTVAAVVVGDSPWPLPEIAAFCGCDVLARVPHVRRRRAGDPSMKGAEWRPWWSAVRGLTSVLLGPATA